MKTLPWGHMMMQSPECPRSRCIACISERTCLNRITWRINQPRILKVFGTRVKVLITYLQVLMSLKLVNDLKMTLSDIHLELSTSKWRIAKLVDAVKSSIRNYEKETVHKWLTTILQQSERQTVRKVSCQVSTITVTMRTNLVKSLIYKQVSLRRHKTSHDSSLNHPAKRSRRRRVHVLLRSEPWRLKLTRLRWVKCLMIGWCQRIRIYKWSSPLIVRKVVRLTLIVKAIKCRKWCWVIKIWVYLY